MANDKNNSNELVAEDTAELEAITSRQERATGSATMESDDNTFDFADHAHAEPKTVRKLRYDVEQLRSKWLGLESELRAREEITDDLNAELLMELHERGIAAPSSTTLNDKFAIRVAICNHRSRREDFRALVDGVRQVGRELVGGKR